MVKGLRLSLRRYVLWTLFSLTATIIILFSIQSSDSFFDGMDGMLRHTMIRAAKTTDLGSNSQVEFLGIYISKSYHDLPKEIKQSFSEKDFKPFVLLKDINKPHWLERPISAKFALLVPMENGEQRYISQSHNAPPDDGKKRFRINHTVYSMIIGSLALASFSTALLLLMRSVARPVEKLQQWAANLNENKLDTPIPTFRYKELDALAHIIHRSLKDVSTALEREREFVNHASHELRTPITVVRNSVALLQRVIDAENTKGNNAVARIDHASKTMVDLTETLLWLGRDSQDPIPSQEVNIKAMVEELSHNLKYLLTGKDVSVHFELSDCTLTIAKTASEIIIGNLIRNAYQRTQCGSVSISLSQNILKVINKEKEDSEPHSTSSQYPTDIGFGMGLKLIDKLTAKLNWVYTHRALGSSYEVTLELRQDNSVADHS